MVTTVLLSDVRKVKLAEERAQFFEHIEARFARQARWSTLRRTLRVLHRPRARRVESLSPARSLVDTRDGLSMGGVRAYAIRVGAALAAPPVSRTRAALA